MTTRLTRTLVAIGVLAGVLTACTGHDEPDNPAAPESLSDPYLLITDEVLERLIPGGIRASTEHLGTISGHKNATWTWRPPPAPSRCVPPSRSRSRSTASTCTTRRGAWVLYRLFEPQELPTDAERLMRDLLAAAANSLPT